MTESRRFEDRVAPSMERIAEFAYGFNLPIFGEGSVVFVPSDVDTKLEIPRVIRTDDGPQLQISYNGARRWEDKFQEPCSEIGVETEDFYIGSGLGILEMSIASQLALDGDEEIMERVLKTSTILDNTKHVEAAAVEISEHTQVAASKLLSAFDTATMESLNILRYGMAVSLASLGVKPGKIRQFRSSNRQRAAESLELYSQSSARYLQSRIFGAKSPAEYRERLATYHDRETVIEGAIRTEPPVVEFAAASVMNVTHYFNK